MDSSQQPGEMEIDYILSDRRFRDAEQNRQVADSDSAAGIDDIEDLLASFFAEHGLFAVQGKAPLILLTFRRHDRFLSRYLAFLGSFDSPAAQEATSRSAVPGRPS
jgi:hypothetical protein